MITILKEHTNEFEEEVKLLENRFDFNIAGLKEVESTVINIINDVKCFGNSAVAKLTKKFDNLDLAGSRIKIEKAEFKEVYSSLDTPILESLKKAAENIFRFHKEQFSSKSDLRIEDKTGTFTGQFSNPLNIAGIYVPGGKALYPSTVLMNAIPAKVAGVNKIIMCTPTDRGFINPYIIAAADLAGVDEIYKIGGAQAIAAMAYGTETIPRVDKIVGPGNIYVATAKKMVFGIVDIDMIAGPSEIVVLADSTGNPEFIAADLLAQAEHDEMAIPVLVTTSAAIAEGVILELEKQIEGLERRKIIKESLKLNCKVFLVSSLKNAMELTNKIAPEHLSLSVNEPEKSMKYIKNAGAIFLGHYSPEAVGDYLAGPNHVLPTCGSARFASPLGVYDFIKKTSFISYTKRGLKMVYGDIKNITDVEGLTAHQSSVAIRIKYN